MSNSVVYYEKKFDEACSEFQKVIEAKHGHTPGLNFLESMAVQSAVSAIPEGINPEMAASVAILKIYLDKKTAHHKDKAQAIAAVSGVLLLGGQHFTKAVQSDNTMLSLLLLAVMPTIGVEDLKKITPDQDAKLKEELKKNVLSPSPEVRKNLLSTLIKTCVENTTFAEKNSDFASLSFVLIKRLHLTVPNEVMRKVIQGASFSAGVFYCGTDKSRRADELASLVQSPEQKNAVTHKI